MAERPYFHDKASDFFMRILLATAFALGAGLMMTRVFKWLHFKCPDVTAFLIAGGALLAIAALSRLRGVAGL